MTTRIAASTRPERDLDTGRLTGARFTSIGGAAFAWHEIRASQFDPLPWAGRQAAPAKARAVDSGRCVGFAALPQRTWQPVTKLKSTMDNRRS
jgi:hypothetical protein